MAKNFIYYFIFLWYPIVKLLVQFIVRPCSGDRFTCFFCSEGSKNTLLKARVCVKKKLEGKFEICVIYNWFNYKKKTLTAYVFLCLISLIFGGLIINSTLLEG